jgi:E1A-binding protein p400
LGSAVKSEDVKLDVDAPPSLDQSTWNIKTWKKVQEPQRNKTHHDYLLQEMEWLSRDFREERQWKVALARKAAKAVTRWHAERAQLTESGGSKSAEYQTKQLAKAICREVLDVWQQVGRVVAYKHDLRLEEARQESRNKHLEFIVGQTQRYTEMLTDGMNRAGETTNGEDEDEDEDDEEEGEGAARPKVEKVDRQAELAALQAEAERPLDQSLLEVVNQDDDEEEDSDDDEDEDEDEDEEGEEGDAAEGDAMEVEEGNGNGVGGKKAVVSAENDAELTISAGSQVPAQRETAAAAIADESAPAEAAPPAEAAAAGSHRITSTLAAANSIAPNMPMSMSDHIPPRM